jgi:hypothetical protein
MPVFAKGKRSLAISDRSGMQFPYLEMVKEWNGSLVHFSEYEAKQPQLELRSQGGDAQALQFPRADVRPGGACLVLLDLYYWPGQYVSNGMQPGISGDIINTRRAAYSAVGNVTITGIDINITANVISNVMSVDLSNVTIVMT